MIEDLFDTIDNETGEILSRAVMKLGKRSEIVSLDPINSPCPSDGFPNMAQRVRAVRRMTPKERALTAIMHRDTPPAGLTTHERRNWLDGLSQIGG
jgi:hypothetical protein